MSSLLICRWTEPGYCIACINNEKIITGKPLAADFLFVNIKWIISIYRCLFQRKQVVAGNHNQMLAKSSGIENYMLK